MAIVKNSAVTVNGQPATVFWLGSCKFSGQARIGVRFNNGSTRFLLAAYAVEVQPKLKDWEMIEDPGNRAERELAEAEFLASCPSPRIMVREMLRGMGDEYCSGDELARQFEDSLDRE